MPSEPRQHCLFDAQRLLLTNIYVFVRYATATPNRHVRVSELSLSCLRSFDNIRDRSGRQTRHQPVAKGRDLPCIFVLSSASACYSALKREDMSELAPISLDSKSRLQDVFLVRYLPKVEMMRLHWAADEDLFPIVAINKLRFVIARPHKQILVSILT